MHKIKYDIYDILKSRSTLVFIKWKFKVVRISVRQRLKAQKLIHYVVEEPIIEFECRTIIPFVSPTLEVVEAHLYTVVHSSCYKLHALRALVSKFREITILLLTEDPIERALLNFLNSAQLLVLTCRRNTFNDFLFNAIYLD